MNKPPSTRIKISMGAKSFTFGPKTDPPLPDPEDYEVVYKTSWAATPRLKKIPNQGFIIYFDAPCPTDNEYIDLIITDKKGKCFSVGEISV